MGLTVTVPSKNKVHRYPVLSLFCLLVSLSAVPGTASQIVAAEHLGAFQVQTPKRNLELTPVERAFIALQLVRGDGRVEILIAARKGQVGDVSRKLGGISGEVLMQDAEIDFVRASIPIARVLEVMGWPEITTAQIDTGDEAALFAADGVAETDVAVVAVTKPGVPPTAYTARANPYTGESATESLQFKMAHPTYDGRGVVIGGIEPVDMRTPSLKRARSLEGNLIPKFADYVLPIPPRVRVGAIPEEDQIGYGWQQTATVQPGEDRRVTFNGKAYTIPESVWLDELRMALVRARPVRSASPFSPGISSEMTVLWAVNAGKVWLCESGQTDFNKEIAFDALPSLPHRPALAQLPHGDNRTFMIAVDLPLRAIRLRYGGFYHGTMGASTAAGHTFLNSEAEGVAPAAQFFPMDFGSVRDHTTMQLSAWIELFRDPRVDVITNSSGMGDARRLSGPRSVYWQFIERLVARYPKIMFKSAGNLGPYGIKELGYTGSGAVVMVGAYTPLETWEANFGLTPTFPITPPSYSSYGPSSDGGFKPDLLSLTGTLSAAKPASSALVFGASPYYEMPAGYGLSGGTSAATPNAAGHAALLISAAKQSGIPHDPARLKIALFSTCLFLEGVPAHVQGHGLIQIAQAWEALWKIRDYTPPTFTTEAPVRGYRGHHSSTLITPNVGRGIYERIGWVPKQSGEREITITRTSGPPHPVSYHLRWQEAKQRTSTGAVRAPAFSSPLEHLSLPLNQAVTIPVQIQLGESGAYSAILDLLDPDFGVVVHSVMCTVIAAEQLTPENGYTTTVTRTAPHPGNGLVFVNVPPGAAALRVELKQKNGKLVTLNAQRPDGGRPRVWADYPGNSAPIAWELKPSARETYDQTFVNPQPGVWQFWVDHENGFIDTYDPELPRPAPACEFTIRVSAVGARVETEQEKSPSQMKVSFASQLAKITNAHVVPLALGGMHEEETVLPPGLSPVFYQADVAPGTTKLKAVVDAKRESQVSVSIIIFHLTGNKANPVTSVAFDIGLGSRKQVEVIHPKPGKYRICLDAWGAVPGGGLRVRYRTELYGPQYGKLVAKQKGRTGRDETLRAVISWKPQTKTLNGRRLVAEVGLVSNDYVNMSDVSQKEQPARVKADQPARDVTTRPVPIAVATIILPQDTK